MAGLLLLILALLAPVPFPRPRERPPEVSVFDDSSWGLVRCEFTLRRGGGYECLYMGRKYVGSWRRDDAGLWITESCHPSDARSWRTYCMKVEQGAWEGWINDRTYLKFARKPR